MTALGAYAGIGSRKTPQPILDIMSNLARDLSRAGWTLRSGGAAGADTAFEGGALCHDGPASEIYQHATPAAYALAEQFHPAWSRLSPLVQRLHARNGHQILGRDLDDPVRFVVCWTPDGADSTKAPTKASGGTGQAIRIARHHRIPVFNLLDRYPWQVANAVLTYAEIV